MLSCFSTEFVRKHQRARCLLRKLRELPLPKGWPSHVKSGVLHIISLAHFSMTHARAWAAKSVSASVRIATENNRLHQEIALLPEEAPVFPASPVNSKVIDFSSPAFLSFKAGLGQPPLLFSLGVGVGPGFGRARFPGLEGTVICRCPVRRSLFDSVHSGTGEDIGLRFRIGRSNREHFLKEGQGKPAD